MHLSHTVGIVKGLGFYPSEAPYDPSERFPEYPFGPVAGEGNPGYSAVRHLFALLRLDAANCNTGSWNPLGEIVRPGDHVVLKPNLIAAGHPDRSSEWQQVITHPSIIRAVLDYVYIALKGSGQVTIAEGPQTDSDFDEIRRRTGLDDVVRMFNAKGLPVSLVDLRTECWHQVGGITRSRRELPGDPNGYSTITLDASSEFAEYRLNGRFYGADYDTAETASYHCGGRHSYVISRTVMNADVVINLPKMKTHKKTGVTLALKNLVGVTGCRNCLPHHTIGTPTNGGDEFRTSSMSNHIQSKLLRLAKAVLALQGGRGGPAMRGAFRLGRFVFGDTSEVIRSGNWSGNDTIWRTVLDLNRALFHFDADGNPRSRPLRYLVIVDGIIAGEGNGPVAVDAKPCGVIAGGINPVAVDTVCAALMGFDYSKIPMLHRAWQAVKQPLIEFPPELIECRSNLREWQFASAPLARLPNLGFHPHVGWAGQIERSLVHCYDTSADI